MKAVVQRVVRACVLVDGEQIGYCGQGLLVFAAAHRNDTCAEAVKLADRIAGVRLFNDTDGKINLSLRDLGEGDAPRVLAVSNFTIYGDASKNRRPSFTASAPFDHGKLIFDAFVEELKHLGIETQTGQFGADMSVEVVNDGPVTIIIEAEAKLDTLAK